MGRIHQKVAGLPRLKAPWAAATLRKEFRALILGLEAGERIGTGLTFHGLRDTAAKMLADRGADVRAIQAMLGHRSAAMALHYSREADTAAPRLRLSKSWEGRENDRDRIGLRRGAAVP